jgi:hypothetical protein
VTWIDGAPIGGDLKQHPGSDVERRAWRKEHGDDVERDLGVIGEIAEVGADRSAEIRRSELADQSRERPYFTSCHWLRFLLFK